MKKKINAWLVQIGEPLPIEKGTMRGLRTGILADYIVDNNGTVYWWASTFDHLKEFTSRRLQLLNVYRQITSYI